MQVGRLREVVEGGRGEGEADAEGGVLNGTEDNAELHVDACPRDGLFVIHLIGHSTHFIAQPERFLIAREAVYVHVVDAHGNAAVDAVVDVEREIEVVLLDAAPACAAVFVGVGITRLVACQFALVVVDGRQHLRVVAHTGERRGVFAVVVVTEVEPAVIITEVEHLPRLRHALVEPGGAQPDDLLEVAALLVVEAEVDEFHCRAVELGCVDEARLVERGTRLVDVGQFVGLRLSEHRGRHGHVAAAVKADGGWVVRHGAHVGTQGTHGAAHTHEACSAREVGARESLCFIDVLRLHRAAKG